jgi:GDP-L-fucose synthase
VKILVTGGNGFLGKHTKLALVTHEVLTPTSKELNLLSRDQVNRFMIDNRPETVVHLAGTVGGIGLNQAEPGRLTYENLQMGLNIIEESRLHNVSKFVCVGTICSMAHSCPAPFQEEDFIQFNRSGPGMPEITNAGYGLAKRMLYEMLLNYRRQYGMKFAYLLPTNQVGPGDHFEEHKSHVVPALIKRIYEAKELDSPYVQVWGDGTATRDFLDIRDTAKAIAKTVESYEGEAPINLGSGCELSIKEVVGVICKVVGYQGGIIWDASKPNGQPRRVLDITRAKQLLNFSPTFSFEESVRDCYEQYLEEEFGDEENS